MLPFSFSFAQAKGFTHANLTLKDPACKATVNATHYTLETPLTGCLTTVFPMTGSPMAFHLNSVSTAKSHTSHADKAGLPEAFQNGRTVSNIIPTDAKTHCVFVLHDCI